MHTLLLFMASLVLSPALPGIDEAGLQKLVETHDNKALVINFWATWCAPCREEFPELVELYERRKEEGLEIVAISMDEPEDVEKALQFLREQKANFPSYIRSFEDFYRFVDAVDPDWTGALPATFVFDSEGNRAYSKVGKVTIEELEQEIAPFLE